MPPKLPWIFNRFVRSLRDIRKSGFPYLTRHTLAGMPLSAVTALKVADFPGLLFVQYAEDLEGRIELSTYWKSRQAAIENSSLLADFLKQKPLVFEGYIRSLEEHREPWLQRVPVGRWILYAASLFGAFAAMETYFARLLEKPDISIQIPGPVTVSVLENDEIIFDAALVNRSRELPTVVTLETPKIIAGDEALAYTLSGNLTPPPISAASTTLVQFRGNSLPTGTYAINLSAKARTGYLRRSGEFRISKDLRVWSLEPEVKIDAISPEKEHRAWLKGRILIGAGAPEGLTCQATIQKAPFVSFGFVNFPGVQEWKDQPEAATPGLEVRSTSFVALRPFGQQLEFPFQISLDSTEKVDWKKILVNSEIICERTLKGLAQ